MEKIWQAVTGGYRGLGKYEADPRFHLVRQRADFQKWLRELEAPVEGHLRYLMPVMAELLRQPFYPNEETGLHLGRQRLLAGHP